jgi:hypothetical protein
VSCRFAAGLFRDINSKTASHLPAGNCDSRMKVCPDPICDAPSEKTNIECEPALQARGGDRWSGD